MATVLDSQVKDVPPTVQTTDGGANWKLMQKLLRPIASLKLTVVLFLASIFIVLVGTLAQVDHDIWKVVRDYFRVDLREVFQPAFPWFNISELFVWINPKLFFPPAFFPEGAPNFPPRLGFWFPKGWVIGTLMMFNLFAAHLVRFKVQAAGNRLYAGWGVIALGSVITWLVILSGSNPDGLQANPLISYSTLWWLMQTSIFGLCAISLYVAATAGKEKAEQRWLFSLVALLLGVTSFVVFQLEVSNDATMRILYQVIKATFAGVVLLAGCLAVFKKRGGIVLLHAGIGLMMFYDVLVGLEHVESQMHIAEGETVNFSRDMRDAELAVMEPLAGNREDVTVVDLKRLAEGQTFADPRFPFKIKVIHKYPHSTFIGPMQPRPEGVPEKNPATAGLGLQVRAVPVAGSTGTDSNSSFDLPSAYVELFDKSDKSLGTYLVSTIFDANFSNTVDQVTVDGKTYDLSLRFRRLYNDYNITLKDVQKNDYKGTDKPRDYSSYITLEHPGQQTKIEHRVWMNNPMRYAGKTFYQSSFAKLSNDQEMTTLQVVDNAGWMTPYVACMMVVVGMFYHFGQTLLRFLHRRMRETSGDGLLTDASDETLENHITHGRNRYQVASWVVTGAIVGSVAAAFAMVSMPAREKPDDYNLSGFGELPIWYKGRSQPLDTFARNSLMQLSDRQSFDHAPFAYVLPRNWKVASEKPGEVAALTVPPGDHGEIEIAVVDIKPEQWLETVNRFRTSLKLSTVTEQELKASEKETKFGRKSGILISGKADDQDFLIARVSDKKKDLAFLVQGTKAALEAERTRFDDFVASAGFGSKSAIGWMLELMANEYRAESYRVIRVESDEVRNAFGLPAREGLRYSFNELKQMDRTFFEQAQKANEIPSKERTLMQRKTLELANSIMFFQLLESTVGRPPQLPPQTADEAEDTTRMASRAQQHFELIRQGREALKSFARETPLPLVVPTHIGVDQEKVSKIPMLNTNWETLTIAHSFHHFYSEFPAPMPPATNDFVNIVNAYRDGDVAKFNKDIKTYQTLLNKYASAEDLPVEKVNFEAWYNRTSAFNLCSWLYVFAFVLAVTGWLALPQVFERSAFWLTVLIFAVHTLALIGRIYISGRPPVTNLYSSAVFIGWAVVLGGLIMEWMTRMGIGNFVATISGFLTLRIAHGLASDGDTFVVLEAVLDTQFWLATHVVCISLGYATTYMAGLLGALFVLLGVFTPTLKARHTKELTRMTYGTICFAIFFSFWGTVLGGLWADDSWGRFWGWDPKENGALIIVLWNALVLHARWGGMVRDRGLALLAILGNVVTSWSWFGVNELGVGLHSYGFTEGRLRMLALFVISQLLIVAIGLIPKQYWRSFRVSSVKTDSI